MPSSSTPSSKHPDLPAHPHLLLLSSRAVARQPAHSGGKLPVRLLSNSCSMEHPRCKGGGAIRSNSEGGRAGRHVLWQQRCHQAAAGNQLHPNRRRLRTMSWFSLRSRSKSRGGSVPVRPFSLICLRLPGRKRRSTCTEGGSGQHVRATAARQQSAGGQPGQRRLRLQQPTTQSKPRRKQASTAGTMQAEQQQKR